MLTESEIAALDDDESVSSSEAPSMTTAAPGGLVEDVEAGMRQADMTEQEGRGRTGEYAEGGALAKDLKKVEREKKAGEPGL